jgi:hypothetical protein
MTGVIRPLNGRRLLIIATSATVTKVLDEHANRPIVTLLTWNDPGANPAMLKSAIASLLDAGCEYFVCAGVASEALHDWIDDFVIGRASPSGGANVTTTWHQDEGAADVAEFFVDVAGAKAGALLLAALNPEDVELRDQLVRLARP